MERCRSRGGWDRRPGSEVEKLTIRILKLNVFYDFNYILLTKNAQRESIFFVVIDTDLRAAEVIATTTRQRRCKVADEQDVRRQNWDKDRPFRFPPKNIGGVRRKEHEHVIPKGRKNKLIWFNVRFQGDGAQNKVSPILFWQCAR